MLLNTCCGCISLQRGSIIIGSWTLITAVSHMILIGTNFESMEPKKLEAENSLSSNATATEIPSTAIIHNMIYATLLIYFIIEAIVCGLMIAGSVRNNSTYMLPWLVISFVGVGFMVCIILGVAVVAILVASGGMFGFLLYVTAITALRAYFWLVEYSHYKHVVAQNCGHETRPNDGKVLSEPQMNYHNV